MSAVLREQPEEPAAQEEQPGSIGCLLQDPAVMVELLL
jgi:hypothetical protein